jgi:Cu(I)/Ag(I) efflux system membrane fusion protein/cobalt-zinc-cadmium efflux system membrane fusion protein
MTEKKAPRRPATIIGVMVVTAILTLLIAGVGAYMGGYLRPKGPSDKIKTPSGKMESGHDRSTKQGGERKILYWRAPMNPNEIYDRPGKSAMGMDLVPVYEDEGGSGSEIRIDPVIQQDMGIRTSPVRKGPLVHTILTYGHITEDETRTTEINPKTSGWVEKLYVDFTGKYVERGDPLFEFYSPDLVAAQEEYLVAKRNLGRLSDGRAEDLLESARRRLQYFDIAESEIRKIEETGKVQKSLLIRSPFSGFVIQKNVNDGDFVRAGTTVFRISDLSHVWVEAHIYEYELPWVSIGQDAEMTLTYLPGKVFQGKVTYVYPYLQQKTRDVVIRLEFENPDYELKPDMYADVRIKSRAKGEGLIIPSEAVIRSGQRNIVFVVRAKGKFTPRDVILGRTLDDGRVQILVGVSEGETIVTSGQFLLDSESKLREAVQKMLEPKKVKEEEDFFKELEE